MTSLVPNSKALKLEKMMTWAIREDDEEEASNVSGYYKSHYQEITQDPVAALTSQLRAHLGHVSQFGDEKHVHKRNVLEVAIKLLTGIDNTTHEHLRAAIEQNPSYNKAIFSSKTQEYVEQAIQLAPATRTPETRFTPSAAQKKLIVELQTQLNALAGKTDEKYLDKSAVLKIAINALNGKATAKDIQEAVRAHPRYNEALFTSKTEQLIHKALEIAPTLTTQRGMSPL